MRGCIGASAPPTWLRRAWAFLALALSLGHIVESIPWQSRMEITPLTVSSAGEASGHTPLESFRWLPVLSRFRQALRLPAEPAELATPSSEGPSVQHMDSTRQHDATSAPESEASSSEGSTSHSLSLTTAHARPSSHRQADQVQPIGLEEVQEASPAASAERHRIEASGAVDLRVANEVFSSLGCVLIHAQSFFINKAGNCRILLSGLKNLFHILRSCSSSFCGNTG